MTRRVLRRTGRETTEQRARRLAKVAVAWWRAKPTALSPDDELAEFFAFGYRTAVDEMITVKERK